MLMNSFRISSSNLFFYFQTYDIAHEGYKQNRLDEELKADSNAYKALEKKIKEKMKEKNSKEDEQN